MTVVASGETHDRGVDQITYTLPARVSAGNLILLRASCTSNTSVALGAVSNGSAYQTAGQRQFGTQTSSLIVQRTAVASDAGADVTFKFGVSTRVSVTCIVLDSAASAPIFAAVMADVATDGGYDHAAVADVPAGATMLVWDVAQIDAGFTSVSWTRPDGFTRRVLSATDASGGNNLYVGVADMTVGPAGSYGPFTSTWSTPTNGGEADLLVIAPAATSGGGPVVTRPFSGPPVSRLANIWHITDVHTEVSTYQPQRMAKVVLDAASPMLYPIDGIAETGDAINNGPLTVDAMTSEDAEYLQWQADILAAAGLPSDQWAQVIGNHDGAGQFRDSAEWAATYGLPGFNYVRKCKDVNIVCIGPDSILNPDGLHPYGQPAIQLSSATVRWLDDTLTSLASEPCVVACHAPLPEATANGVNAWVNTDAFGPGANDLLQVLDAHHDHLAAYLSGHTHVQPYNPEMFALIGTGQHTIVHVNAGWIGGYLRPDIGGAENGMYRTITSLVVSVLDDLSVECRWRESGARIFYGPQGRKIKSLAGA